MSQPDFAPAIEFLSQDKLLGDVVKATEPPAWQMTENAYWTLSRTIVFQQLSGKVANVIWARYLSLFGPNLDCPHPDQVVKRPAEDLRNVGLSWQKAAYLADLSQKFCDGEITHEQLVTSDDESVREMLLAVKGIGPWCVDMFLMFGLCRQDVWPIGDQGIRNGCKLLLGREVHLPQKEIQDLGDQWKPYRAVAAHYIWRSIDVKVIK